jgi:hypothetical protein
MRNIAKQDILERVKRQGEMFALIVENGRIMNPQKEPFVEGEKIAQTVRREVNALEALVSRILEYEKEDPQLMRLLKSYIMARQESGESIATLFSSYLHMEKSIRRVLHERED